MKITLSHHYVLGSYSIDISSGLPTVVSYVFRGFHCLQAGVGMAQTKADEPHFMFLPVHHSGTSAVVMASLNNTKLHLFPIHAHLVSNYSSQRFILCPQCFALH